MALAPHDFFRILSYATTNMNVHFVSCCKGTHIFLNNKLFVNFFQYFLTLLFSDVKNTCYSLYSHE